MGGQIGYRDETAYFANVYTAKGEEILEAAGFYAVGPDTSYEIYAVPDFQGIQSLDFTRPVASGTLEMQDIIRFRWMRKCFDSGAAICYYSVY